MFVNKVSLCDLTYGYGCPEKEERDVGLHEAGGQWEAAPHQHTFKTPSVSTGIVFTIYLTIYQYYLER